LSFMGPPLQIRFTHSDAIRVPAWPGSKKGRKRALKTEGWVLVGAGFAELCGTPGGAGV
jgi:hypothetical protein